MNGSYQVGLNGSEVWAYVVETGGGMRLRLDLTDWERTGLGVGRQIPVRLPGKADEWLFVTHATDVPPFVWVVLAKRVEPAARPVRLRRRHLPAAAVDGTPSSTRPANSATA